MKIETAFEETIAFWTAMVESGRTKVEEGTTNPTFSHIQDYRSYCPMCEYGIQHSDCSELAQPCSHCFDWDSGTDVRIKMCKQIEVYTNTNNKPIFPEFPIPNRRGCMSVSSPYYAWDFFTDTLVKSDGTCLSAQVSDQQAAALFLRKQMRYWAGEVAVLVSKRYEEWKEKQNGIEI